MSTILPILEQIARLEEIKSDIDSGLRENGFDTFLARHGVDPRVASGRLVVARSFVYSSNTADIDRDLDPTAQRIAVHYEVGREVETPSYSTYHGLPISEALMGGDHTPVESGAELTIGQHDVVAGYVRQLMRIRQNGLYFLTRSLRKIDVAGD